MHHFTYSAKKMPFYSIARHGTSLHRSDILVRYFSVLSLPALELPPKLQKNFALMIGNMQQPLYYDGFGIALLNMETFGKVSNFYKSKHSARQFDIFCTNIVCFFFFNFHQFFRAIFTYYMILKTVTE